MDVDATLASLAGDLSPLWLTSVLGGSDVAGDGSPEVPAAVACQVEQASKSRQGLVEQWREISKPRKQPTIAPQPKGAKLDFPPLFEEWLEARDLGDALERVENQRGWLVYRYKREPVVTPEAHWEQAFHGTWWYPVWLLLQSGILLESNDHGLGHDFWEPGVYCSPKLETGRWYARPHILFGDGVFHRVVLELRVDPERRKKNRQRGGIQWVFNSDAVSIYGVWVQVNAPPVKGEERVNDWDPALEAVPPGKSAPPPTVNAREGPWPEVEDDDGDDEVWSAPHLGFSPPAAAASGASAVKAGKLAVGDRVCLSAKGRDVPVDYDWSNDALRPGEFGEVVEVGKSLKIRGPRGEADEYEVEDLDKVSASATSSKAGWTPSWLKKGGQTASNQAAFDWTWPMMGWGSGDEWWLQFEKLGFDNLGGFDGLGKGENLGWSAQQSWWNAGKTDGWKKEANGGFAHTDDDKNVSIPVKKSPPRVVAPKGRVVPPRKKQQANVEPGSRERSRSR